MLVGCSAIYYMALPARPINSFAETESAILLKNLAFLVGCGGGIGPAG
jgi:hypothetical protein